MESVYIDKSFEAKVLNGNQIKLDVDSSTENNQPLKVFISPDNFIGIGRIRNSLLHIDKLLK
jgi:hypothetical protein